MEVCVLIFCFCVDSGVCCGQVCGVVCCWCEQGGGGLVEVGRGSGLA